MKLLCLLTGGPLYRIIDSQGKVWLFELHSYCGPTVLTAKTEEIATVQPGERSRFWPAFELWEEQGKQTKMAKGKYPWCEWKPRPKCACGHERRVHGDPKLNRKRSCIGSPYCPCDGWKPAVIG